MRDLKCVRVLLAAADRDIEILQLMHDSTGGPDEIFGFHAQQAAEKSLKAWLAFLGEVYPLTHDLDDLLERLSKRDADVSKYRELTAYSAFAVQFRYEGMTEGFSIDRERALHLVSALLQQVRRMAEAEAEMTRKTNGDGQDRDSTTQNLD
ncbi:MAG: HEPN domain-containing protein [Gemmatimonadetes bacterium]|nr:HEPN domain-containing protein [Gemmatimonadota bacterium]